MPILFGTVFSRGLVHANPLLWMMIVFSYDVMTTQRCEFNFLSRIIISIASSYFFREFKISPPILNVLEMRIQVSLPGTSLVSYSSQSLLIVIC